jgi:PEP-CTERM motif
MRAPANVSLNNFFGGLMAVASAAALMMAQPAQAAPIGIIGAQAGVPGVNCGTGNHSTFLGSGATEFNFDSLGATPSCTSATAPSSFYSDYGAMPAGTYGDLTFSGTGAEVVVGSTATAATPWADSTPYLTVPIPGKTGGSETVAINPLLQANYFGLYWGSIDDANAVKFTLNDGSTYTFTGVDLGPVADGLSQDVQNQTVPATNVYVDFGTISGYYIVSVEFSDGNSIAFELDNLAYGVIDPDPVPEPGSLSLFAAAALGLVAFRRRKRA